MPDTMFRSSFEPEVYEKTLHENAQRVHSPQLVGAKRRSRFSGAAGLASELQ